MGGEKVYPATTTPELLPSKGNFYAAVVTATLKVLLVSLFLPTGGMRQERIGRVLRTR